MSQVLAQAKKHYQRTIAIEIIILILVSFIIGWGNVKSAVDFAAGFCCSFLPFCGFVLIAFYHKQNLSTKLTALYRAEAVKFVLTLILGIIAFKWLEVANVAAFFVGFLLALVLNTLIPLYLNKK